MRGTQLPAAIVNVYCLCDSPHGTAYQSLGQCVGCDRADQTTYPLPGMTRGPRLPAAEQIERDARAALREDVGAGDISARLIAPSAQARARVITRANGIFCGRPWVEEACRQVDERILLDWRVRDGSSLAAGSLLVSLAGPARGLLTVERTALNFMQLLSATATRASRFVAAIDGTGTVVLDTRKTLPGLRAAQKYAVRVGGARNHRMGLFDGYLLKENHIAAAGGIAEAVSAARRAQPGRAVQVEVETSDQLEEAIVAGADSVLLDNHSLTALRAAVAQAAGRVPLEASGGITLDNVAAVARTGVAFVSIGSITKNVTSLDLSMRLALDDDCAPVPG